MGLRRLATSDMKRIDDTGNQS